ncbi:MAG TPA: hypothetical protein VJ046_00580 [Candidatus Paceibacterota bacterium]|nr:hypothetical protein [Candidatus Paceibacterota bacterium]
MRTLELLFVVALLLYSFVIWVHKFRKDLSLWMVWLFGIGLAADVSGTVIVCVLAAKSWVWNLHTVSGLLSLIIMATHFAWALCALKVKGDFETYFNRFSVWAWLLWLVAFVSGIPR